MNLLMLTFCFLAVATACLGQPNVRSEGSDGDGADVPGDGGLIAPVQDVRYRDESAAVAWGSLARQTLHFLNIQHGFRLATESGTRSGLRGQFFAGYERSLRSLHGWSDGDPFYVNYIGHPMMGSVAGNIWAQNDRKFEDVTFGRDRAYWKSRLRAAGFSFVYSAQFELGPYSEATIGKIQSKWPAQGIEDMVITPSLGLGWMVAEDAIDELLLRRVERWTDNNWVRLLLRSSLNPTRTMANVLAGRVPWYRASRSGVYAPHSWVHRPTDIDPRAPADPPPGVAPFEFTATAKAMQYSGGSFCPGGASSAAFRLAKQWQLVFEASGCKVSGLKENLSGDVLSWLVGPRWKAAGDRRLSPHLQFLVGGTKVSHERIDEKMLKDLKPLLATTREPQKYRELYAKQEHDHSLALAAGGGLDLKLGQALALRLANVEYRRAWSRPAMSGTPYNQGLQLSTGIVLRMGTW